MGFDSFATIATAFFIVTVSPGPANIALSGVSAGFGRRSGLLFGSGLAVGLGFWGVVAATGLGAILQAATGVLTALKLLCGLYLLWLAFQSARSAIKPAETKNSVRGGGRWFLQGLVLNLSNPKAVIAWMAALTVGLDASGTIYNVAVATSICIAISFANYFGYAIVFSASFMMNGYRRIHRWVDGALAALFAIAGFGLVRSAFER